MSRVVSLCLGVFLGSVALSGCIADGGESDPDVLEQEEVDDVDLALDDGVFEGTVEAGVRELGGTQLPDTDESAGESTDGPPGEEEEEPDPHPWFAPADPMIDDSDPAGTPI